MSTDVHQLEFQVLKPLSNFVLNRKFIEKPSHQGTKLNQMIDMFNAAFLKVLKRQDSASPSFSKLKKDYIDTVQAGCSRDLKTDCINADLFSMNGLHTSIFTYLAKDLDQQIGRLLVKYQTPRRCIRESQDCRSMVEERYRRLALAQRKRNINGNPEFDFAYLKYARLFSMLLDDAKTRLYGGELDEDKRGPRDLADSSGLLTGYIQETHNQIFESIIARYEPEDIRSPEFLKFVENFNPWSYSKRTADVFRHGIKKMFGYGAQCCLYENKEKTKISKAVAEAIEVSQKESDHFGPSFTQVIEYIREHQGEQIFKNLGVNNLIKEITDPNSKFFNEYFFLVDRLFREHLGSAEVEMVLKTTNSSRTATELPKVVTAYMKIYLIYMVVKTNLYMGNIYSSGLASTQVFEEAIRRSRDLTDEWHNIQGQIALVDQVMGSYFKGRFLDTPEFREASALALSVNRNIHYLSVFPNMSVMVYFLSKMKGKITVYGWFGPIEIDANTILDHFFDGNIPGVWFRFAKDPEILTREMLLYSVDFLLSTGALNSFIDNDDTSGLQKRSLFFDTVLGRYLGDQLESIRADLSKYKSEIQSNPQTSAAVSICNYELNGQGIPPTVEIQFPDLVTYTYSGLGDNGLAKVISLALNGSSGVASTLRGRFEYRATFTRSIIDLIESDLIRAGQIKKPGEEHPETAKAYKLLREIDDLKLQVQKLFLAQNDFYFNCGLKLREIERIRTNRLYEEERRHLGEIYDLMLPLKAITDADELQSRVNQINREHFEPSGSGYRFDRINGLNYRMTKYDLLMRIKKHIESDIFVSPTQAERNAYSERTLELFRRRKVIVYMPEGVERDDMVQRKTSSDITIGDSKEDFIAQGMGMLNGQTSAFIKWRAQMASELTLVNYISTLIEHYVMGPQKDSEGKIYEVKTSDLINAYIKVMGLNLIDELDVKNLREFGLEGIKERTFFKERFFDSDGRTRLPLFYNLINSVLAVADLKTIDLGTHGVAIRFAQQINNLQTFVFQPSDRVAEIVRERYGDLSHQRMNLTLELLEALRKLDESIEDAKELENGRFTLPLYLDSGLPVTWYTPGSKFLFDYQRANDLDTLIRQFANKTGNLYRTREVVKLKWN